MTDQNLITLQPGTVIAGRYEVVKCLGAGSMGLVYACRHRELAGHLVAVKVLFPEVAKDNVAAARFRNEIVASYGVSHPNVVRAYEYFRDGDLVAYTMEYVGGGDLADRLAQGEKMPISVVVRYLGQIASGVQAIHDAGIVHRDLKPENILLTQEGDVKITDFGIARTGHGPKLTEHGGVVGTIDYVSPEYLERGQVDARSDIYAIGVLGYEMITGQSPFKGDSVIATMTLRLRSDPQQPIQLRPDCPVRLNEIILRAMERNPELRYQSTAEIFHDLQELGEDSLNAPVPSVPVIPVESFKGSEPTAITEDSVVYSRVNSQPKENTYVLPKRGDQAETADIIISRPAMNEIAENMYGTNHDSRLEPLLSTGNQSGNESANFKKQSHVSVGVERLDRQRIRTLSQAVSRGRRTTVLANMAVFVVAIAVGIFVGLAALRYIWPDFFDTKSDLDSNFESGFESKDFR